MIKQLIAIMALTTMTAMQVKAGCTYEANDNDTLIIHHPRLVTIITGDSLQSIKVDGRQDDYDYRYQNTIQLVDSNYVSDVTINSDRWDFGLPFSLKKKGSNNNDNEDDITTHLGFGWNAALGTPHGMDVSVGSSWEIFWTIVEWNFKTNKGRDNWSVGFGLDWRNYRMTNRQRFVKDTEGNILLDAYPAGAAPQFSRVKVFSLQVPLQYSHRIARKFSLGIGPVLNWNTHSSIKTRYKIDGQKYKDTSNDARVTPLTVDIMGTIRTPLLDFYVKYSPCHVLNTAFAPKFQSLSFGIYF